MSKLHAVLVSKGIKIFFVRFRPNYFNPYSVLSAKFKAALTIYENAGAKRSDNQCIPGLQEDLSVEMLFEGNYLQVQTTLYRILENELVLRGFWY